LQHNGYYVVVAMQSGTDKAQGARVRQKNAHDNKAFSVKKPKKPFLVVQKNSLSKNACNFKMAVL